MNTYDVTVLMKVTKTYRIEADSEDEAIEEAHEVASVLLQEDIDEDYDQDTVDCVLVCQES